MSISDWSSDVCSSDLYGDGAGADVGIALFGQGAVQVAKVEQRIEVLDMIVEIIKSENPVQRSRRRRFELKLLRQGLHPVVKRAVEQARTRPVGIDRRGLDRKSTRLNSST